MIKWKYWGLLHMKTLSQIATENGIAKNKLYRYATKHCNDMQRSSRGGILLDAEQESLVLGLISENKAHQVQQGATQQCNDDATVCNDMQRSNATDTKELLEAIRTQYENENIFLKQQVEVLNKEMEIKNNQIENLMEIQRANQVLLHQASEQKQIQGNSDTKKGLFARIFK